MKPAIAIAVLVLVFAVAGCGNDASPTSENYGNLLNSPGVCTASPASECLRDTDCPSGQTCNGLILVQEEHPTGWSRPDCFTCHEIRNIHTVNRTGLPNLDLAAIQNVTRTGGEQSCVQCHGMNGVQQ